MRLLLLSVAANNPIPTVHPSFSPSTAKTGRRQTTNKAQTPTTKRADSMQFRVVIPEHVRSGQYIKVHCPPDGKGSVGREAELRVPKGLKPGETAMA